MSSFVILAASVSEIVRINRQTDVGKNRVACTRKLYVTKSNDDARLQISSTQHLPVSDVLVMKIVSVLILYIFHINHFTFISYS